MLKNKSSLLIVIFILLAGLVLTACSGTQTASTSSQSSSAPQAAELTTESKLAIGMLKLEGTSLAVTAQQAQTLLPLWKAVKALGTSTTASQEEIQSLYKQIEAELTGEQMQTIQKMSLTSADIENLMASMGIQTAVQPSATQTAGRSSAGSNAGGMPAGGDPGAGGLPAGGPPAGGDPGMMVMIPADGTTGQTQVTPVAGSTIVKSGSFPQFIDALITVLDKRAQEV